MKHCHIKLCAIECMYMYIYFRVVRLGQVQVSTSLVGQTMRNFNLAYTSLLSMCETIKHPRYTTLREVKSVAEVFKHQVEVYLHQHNKELTYT